MKKLNHDYFPAKLRPEAIDRLLSSYSTVTDLARFRGWSTSVPITTAVW